MTCGILGHCVFCLHLLFVVLKGSQKGSQKGTPTPFLGGVTLKTTPISWKFELQLFGGTQFTLLNLEIASKWVGWKPFGFPIELTPSVPRLYFGIGQRQIMKFGEVLAIPLVGK